MVRFTLSLLLSATPLQSPSQNIERGGVESVLRPPLPQTPALSHVHPYSLIRASWYGNSFHGRVTASGELFNKFALTCAHRSLPFGTILHLRNPQDGREIRVTVTDRGPFVKGRDLDLSSMAAFKLGFLSKGLQLLEMKVE